MDNLLEQETISSSRSSRKPFSSHKPQLLYLFIWATVVAALAAGIILLLSDVFPTLLLHAPVSAAPLLLIGSTYLGFQALIRPKLLGLFKALIVSTAFLLWGIDQLLPTGWFATILGDIVIVLYVIDLGWMMADRLKRQRKKRHAKPGKLGNGREVLSSQWEERTPLPFPGPSTPEERQRPSQPIIPISRGSTYCLLKRNRLVPLSCTCISPLAPLRSSRCCREMQEASG